MSLTFGHRYRIMAQISSFILVFLLVVFVPLSTAEDSSGLLPEEDDALPLTLVRKPRFIQIHTRLHEDEKPERGIGFIRHLRNVLKGGSIGFEFQLPGKLSRFIERVKKVLPFFSRDYWNRKKNSREEGGKEWVDARKKKDEEADEF